MRCPNCGALVPEMWRINVGAGPERFCTGCAGTLLNERAISEQDAITQRVFADLGLTAGIGADGNMGGRSAPQSRES